MSVQEVCGELRQHWRIFQQSGGGVTLSGGEATAQSDFCLALAQKLHDEIGFHTCLDTSGKASWANFERLIPYLDMVLLDIKHMDPDIHAKGTGKDNRDILSNARRLSKSGIAVLVRLPLLPGFNNGEKNLQELARFLRETGLEIVEIMPYHALGLTKYQALGIPYCFVPDSEPGIRLAVDILSKNGINATVHGSLA